jgi:hypothetical protein
MTDPMVYTFIGLATTLLAAFLGLWLVGGFERRDRRRHTPPAE